MVTWVLLCDTLISASIVSRHITWVTIWGRLKLMSKGPKTTSWNYANYKNTMGLIQWSMETRKGGSQKAWMKWWHTFPVKDIRQVRGALLPSADHTALKWNVYSRRTRKVQRILAESELHRQNLTADHHHPFAPSPHTTLENTGGQKTKDWKKKKRNLEAHRRLAPPGNWPDPCLLWLVFWWNPICPADTAEFRSTCSSLSVKILSHPGHLEVGELDLFLCSSRCFTSHSKRFFSP